MPNTAAVMRIAAVAANDDFDVAGLASSGRRRRGKARDRESVDMMFQAILWDCDGVLIDSELLACKVAADCYTRAGYSLTALEYIERLGRTGRRLQPSSGKRLERTWPLPSIGRRWMLLVGHCSKRNWNLWQESPIFCSKPQLGNS